MIPVTDIILSARTTERYLIIRTYSPLHGRSRSFYTDRWQLLSWLDSTELRFSDFDGYSYLRAVKGSLDSIDAEIVWVFAENERLTGYIDRLILKTSTVREMCLLDESCCEMKFLVHSDTRNVQSRIILTPRAQKQLMQMDQLERHAFVRYLRGAFTWGRESVITIHADGYEDFYFTEIDRGRPCLSGGICISKDTITGTDGKPYPRYRYSTHT